MIDSTPPIGSIQSGLSPNIIEAISDGAAAVPVLDGGKVLVDTIPVMEQDIDDKIKDILNNEPETDVVIADPDHENEIQEAAPPQGLPAPFTPSEAEVNNHNLTHLPYRNWCPICVKGKGKAAAHRCLETHREAGVPVVSIDYTFLCDSGATCEVGVDENRQLFRQVFPLVGLDDSRGAFKISKYTL